MLDGANRGHARCYPCDLGCLDAACAFQRSTPRATSLQDQRPSVTSLEFSPFSHLIDAHRELHITINRAEPAGVCTAHQNCILLSAPVTRTSGGMSVIARPTSQRKAVPEDGCKRIEDPWFFEQTRRRLQHQEKTGLLSTERPEFQPPLSVTCSDSITRIAAFHRLPAREAPPLV